MAAGEGQPFCMSGDGNERGHAVQRVLLVVHEAGVEPARPCEHWHLKPASLPIPPLVHQVGVEEFRSSFGASDTIPRLPPEVNTFLPENPKSFSEEMRRKKQLTNTEG